MKSYTDINQSKKLTAILPFGSADMYYPNEGTLPKFGVALSISDNIPCWSLAALLDFLKDKIVFGGNSPEGWFCCYTIKNPTKLLTIDGDSLVDACVVMVERLHELNLL